MLSGTVDPSITSGRRVIIDGHKGTIRYIGPVPSTSTTSKPPPIYVGIEWDSSDRGKNDGKLDGRTYFTLIQHQYDQCSTAASFLHPKRVVEGISTTLVDALLSKYTSTTTSTDDMYLIANNETRTFHVPIEFVGQTHVQNYMSSTQKLKEVVLTGAKIQGVGEDIEKRLPNVTHLDLTDNLLSAWSEISAITSHLPQLRLLNLTNNYIIPWNELQEHHEEKHQHHESKQNMIFPMLCHTSFPHLTILILNRVPHAWTATCLLSSHHCLPLLEELYLCHNHITSLESTIPNISCDVIFPHLRILDLSSNAIVEWSSLSSLSLLPHLTTLLLNDNPITSITPLSFPSLTSLSLNDCRIQSLTSIDILSTNPSLTSLHLQRNTIDAMFPRSSHLRLYVIGRLSQLTMLNRSTVTSRERTDSEKFYISWCINEIKNIRDQGTQLTQVEIQQRYPRAWELEKDTLIAALSTTSTTSTSTEGTQLVNRLHNITFQHGTTNVSKKVQFTETVGNIRLLGMRTLKLPVAQASQYIMTYKENESSNSSQIMSDVMKPLSYYGVIPDGIIVLQKRAK